MKSNTSASQFAAVGQMPKRFTLTAKFESCRQRIMVGAALIFGTAGAVASSGDSDLTFGQGGVALLDANPGSDNSNNSTSPTCSVYQTDGKLLVGGSRSFTIIRYDLAGILDPTFGGDGKVGINYGSISKLFPQADGSVIAAGAVSDARMGLIKYTNSGVLDLLYARGGIAVSQVARVSSSNPGGAPQFAQQVDGKIVGATTETYDVNGSTAYRVRLERFNADGTPDVGFGSGGFVRVPVANLRAITEIGIAPTGKIVVGFADFAVAVFTASGSLDLSFSGDGYQTVRVDPTNFSQTLGGIVVQPDGKILMSGQSDTNTPSFNYQFAIARLNANGSLDTTFSGDGLVTTDLGTEESNASVALFSDGKIIISGTTRNPALGFVILRYLANGTLDNSFSAAPVPTHGFASYTGPPLLTQPNGSVTVSGMAKESAASTNGGYLTMRFTATGSLDTTFSSDGIAFTQSRGKDDEARAIAVQSDGKILLGGITGLGITVLRTLPDGSLDPSFGGDGRASLDFGVMCESIAVQPDGKVVVAGYSYESFFDSGGSFMYSDYDFVVGRLMANGDADSSFGTNGKVKSHLGGRDDVGHSVAIQADGKILVGGYSNRMGSDQFALVRYLSNGVLDTTFGIAGVVSTPGTRFGYKVLIQADGKILLGGNGNSGFAVARYLNNGSLDLTFNGGGIAEAPLPNGGYCYDTLLQPDGKVIVAGHIFSSASPYNSEFTAVRFEANGVLDTGFGTAGRTTQAIGSNDGYCYGAALQADGKVLMLGWKLNGVDGSRDLALLRLMANGTVDSSFGIDGVVTRDFERSDEEGWEVSTTSNGRILVAGTSRGGTDNDFLLAAFLESSSTAPEIVVQQPAGTDLTDGGSRDFGASDLGAAKTLSFRIQNTGNGPLMLGDLQINGPAAADFTLLKTPYPAVTPGGVSTFVVQFLPSTLGNRTATLSFANNDGNENPFDVSLLAMGQEVGVPPTVTLTSNSSSVFPGASAIFTAAAAGTQPRTFEWFRGLAGDTSNPLVGSASTLSVTPLATTSYWVRVTNRAGTVNSSSVQVVTILPYPNQGDDNIITNVTSGFANTDVLGEVQTVEVSGTRWVLFVRGGRLYSVPFQGGTPVELTAGITTTGSSFNDYRNLSTGAPQDIASTRWWTVSGNQVFFTAGKLYRVPIAGGTAVDLSGGTGTVYRFVISHDGATAFYWSTHLYRVPVTSGAPVQMSNALSLGLFCLTPNGTHLVFAAAPADVQNIGIYSLPVAATTASTPLRLNNPNRPTGTNPSRQIQEFRVSSNSSRVVYRATDDVANEFRLFSATITSASRVNLTSNPAGNYNVRAFSISPDGTRVALHASLPNPFDYRMFSVPIAGGALYMMPFATDYYDDEPIFTSDSLRILAGGNFPAADDITRYGFDYAAGEVATFNTSAAGYTVINEAPASITARFSGLYNLIPAAGGVVYEACPNSSFGADTFLKAASLSGTNHRILDNTLLGARIRSYNGAICQISENGQRVLFVKTGDRSNAEELYSSSAVTGSIRRMHPAITSHNFSIQQYGSVGDGNSAWMIGNYASNGRQDLILSRMPAPTPAVFLTQPASSTINQNQSATLSVTLQGTGPITYQWYQGESGVVTQPISGATSSSYTTPALVGSQFRYWVRATNTVGNSDSSTAVLTLNQPPSITTQPVAASILEGENASFSVVAAGTGTFAYHWYRGAAGNVSNPVGINSASLNHGPIIADTSYWVRVSSSFGSVDSQAATITMIPRLPVFTSATSSSGTAGNQFAFQVLTTHGPNSISCSNLPTWLSLDAASGWLTGTPPSAALTTLNLTASNTYRSSQSTLQITIQPPKPVITSPLVFSGRQGDVFSYQITATQLPTSYTTTTLPGGLALNATTGQISGTPNQNGTFALTLGVVNSGGTGNAVLSLVIAPPIPPPVILSPAFAAGNVNVALSIQATATNSPTTYSLLNAPPWLAVNVSGLLTGTPTSAGVFNFKLRGSNASGPGAYKDISLQIEPNAQAPSITSLVEKRGRKGVVFDFALTASVPATTFTLVSGSLPAGITFSATSGVFSGTPTVAGIFNLVFTASNSFGPGKTSPLRLIIDPPLQVSVITSAASFNLNVGASFSTSVAGSNSPTSFTFANLPGWLVQTGTTGQLIGTPPAPGVFNVSVFATNADGPGNAQAFVFNIAHHPNSPKVQLASGFTAYQGLPFSATLLTSPASTTIAASGFPAGVTLNSAARSLGGTPQTAGNYTVTLQASNANGLGPVTTATFTVLPPPGTPEIISSLTEYGKALEPYTYTIQARSEIPVTRYFASGLPPGLSLNAATGAISGTPREIGTFAVVISASSAAGQGTPATLTLTIRPGSAVPKITSVASASELVERPFSYQIDASNGPITAYAAANLPEGLSLNAVTGLITGKILTPGTFDVVLTAANLNGTGLGQTLKIAVASALGAPIVIVPSHLYLYGTQSFSLQIEAIGMSMQKPWPNGTGIYAQGLPDGLVINSSTGVISGIPDSRYSSMNFYISLFAIANGMTSKTIQFTLIYKKAGDVPIITGPRNLSVGANQNLGFQITTDRPASRWEIEIYPAASGYLGHLSYQGSPVFQVPAASLPRPGTWTYDIGGYNPSGWGVLGGLSLRVDPTQGAPTITSSELFVARAGIGMTGSLTASGSPTEFGADFAGNTPSGITLNSTSGQFTGTPSVPGNYTFLARAKNAQGWSLPKFTTLAILPAAPAAAARSANQATLRGFNVMNSNSSSIYQVGQPFSYTPSVSSGADFFVFGTLPPGLVGNISTGSISGTPEKPGQFSVSIRPFSDNSVGEEIKVAFTILPIAGTPMMGSSITVNGIAGTELAHTLTATPAPAGFNITDLPDFVLVDPLTGAVSGTPNTPGTYTFQASAFSAIGEGMPVTVTLQIAPAAGTPVVVLQQPLPALQVGVPFSATLTSAPAATFYDSGSLPYGINLNPQTGIISGTPLQPSQSEVPLWGVNSNGQGGALSVKFSIAGAPATPVIINPSIVRSIVGEGFVLQLSSSPPAINYSLSPVPSGLAFDPVTGLLSGLLNADATVQVHGSNAFGQGTTKELLIKSFAAPSALWRDEKFGRDASNPAVAGWDASPAGDGITNLLKYALGVDPFGSAWQNLPVASIESFAGSRYLIFTITKNPQATDVLWTPEISSNLTANTWSSGPSFLTVLEETAISLKLHDNNPLQINPQRFVRAKVALISPSSDD